MESEFGMLEFYDGEYTSLLKDKNFKLAYGTAGFWTKEHLLDRVCFRTGIIASLIALKSKRSGIMITASHNPIEDNGVKIVNFNGSVLNKYWEATSEKFINTPNLIKDFKDLLEENEISLENPTESVVIIGYDTWPSSIWLAACVSWAVEYLGLKQKNFGEVTTG